jgi:hypothetical protein
MRSEHPPVYAAEEHSAIIVDLADCGAKIVISQHPRRAMPLQIDTEMYKWHPLIENFFCRLGEFKRIALRRQNRSELPGPDPSRRRYHQLTLNLNRA